MKEKTLFLKVRYKDGTMKTHKIQDDKGVIEITSFLYAIEDLEEREILEAFICW